MGAEGAYDEEEGGEEEHGDIEGSDYEYGEESEGRPSKRVAGRIACLAHMPCWVHYTLANCVF